MQKYVKVVVGFFVILTILTPFLKLVNQGLEQPTFDLIKDKKISWQKIVQQGNSLKKEQHQHLTDDYKRRLIQHINSVVKLNSDLEDFETKVKLDQRNNLTSISIIGTENKVVPVEVDLSDKKQTNPKEEKEEKLKGVIATLYGLNSNQIQVQFQ